MRLSQEKILHTAVRLERRIGERFPDSGLLEVAGDMVLLARDAGEDIRAIARPAYHLRGLSALFIFMIVGGAIAAVWATLELGKAAAGISITDLIQVAEALVNDLVLLGAAIWFFMLLERRRKRARVGNAVGKLRALAHLVDVHQLRKNPEVIGEEGRATPSSPERKLTPFEMGRYFDYCSEMLSITAKVAALYSDRFDDPGVHELVNDLESLTVSLERKIWQKMMVMESRIARLEARGTPPVGALQEE